MKFLAFSELHADKRHNISTSTASGFTTWMENTLDVLDQIFKYAIENGVYHIFHGGDLFEKKNYLPQDLYNFIWDIFKEYSEDLNIYLNTGNHDFHSSISSSLAPFSKICKVITKPTDFIFNDSLIRVIPYGMIDKNLKIPSFEDLIKISTRAISRDEIKEFILFIHEDIAGLKIGGTDYVSGSKYKRQIFGDWDFVFNGHIHKAQRLGNIINMGSVMRHSFAEQEKKYFYHYEDGEIKQIEVDCPKFITTEGFSDKIRATIEKDDYNLYRIDVSPEELSDPIFKKYNAFPNIVKSKEKKKRMDSTLTEEEELMKYMDIVESELDKDKVLEMLKELQ